MLYFVIFVLENKIYSFIKKEKTIKYILYLFQVIKEKPKMSIVSHILSTRTSNYLSRNLFNSARLFIQNRPLTSTSNQTNPQDRILPTQLPSTEKKKAKFNISWKSK
jgi:hypothetical protein